MNCYRREPTLKDLLSDPIIEAVMEADGVDRYELETMLKEVGGKLDAARGMRFWAPWPAGPQHLSI